jgi:hypothetical protein
VAASAAGATTEAALTANAADFERMANICETRSMSDFPGPLLEVRSSHSHRPAAGAANDMMMVPVVVANAIKRLGPFDSNLVDLTIFGQSLQIAVDGGQAYLLARGQKLLVERLSRAEGCSLAESGQHRLAGFRRTSLGHRCGLLIRSRIGRAIAAKA